MPRLIQSSLQLEIRPTPNHFADIMWAPTTLAELERQREPPTQTGSARRFALNSGSLWRQLSSSTQTHHVAGLKDTLEDRLLDPDPVGTAELGHTAQSLFAGRSATNAGGSCRTVNVRAARSDTVSDTLRGEYRRSGPDAIPRRSPKPQYRTDVRGPVRTPNSQAQKPLRARSM
jgi:hypothetical protein